MPRASPVPCVKDFRQLRQELQVYRSEWRRSRTPPGVQGVRGCWSSRTACTPDGVRVLWFHVLYTWHPWQGAGWLLQSAQNVARNQREAPRASPWHLQASAVGVIADNMTTQPRGVSKSWACMGLRDWLKGSPLT